MGHKISNAVIAQVKYSSFDRNYPHGRCWSVPISSKNSICHRINLRIDGKNSKAENTNFLDGFFEHKKKTFVD